MLRDCRDVAVLIAGLAAVAKYDAAFSCGTVTPLGFSGTVAESEDWPLRMRGLTCVAISKFDFDYGRLRL